MNQQGRLTMGIERRKQRRIVLKREVLINGSIKVQGLDLSVGGLCVHTGRHFTTGIIVGVTLPLNSEFISVRARVKNAQESVGMGLEFIDLTPEQKAAIQANVDAVAQDLSRGNKKTVLLVEDNAAVRRMNRSRLVLDGYTVLEAKDGVEALGLLEKEKIDLVVLDLYMELMDGYKVLTVMRQRSEWKDLPVLVFSARSSSDEVDKAISAGATEYLVKMVTSPVKLSQRIKMYLPGIS